MTEIKMDNYFKIDPEPHLLGNLDQISHFPGVRMWWKAIENITRPLISGIPPEKMVGIEEWETGKKC